MTGQRLAEPVLLQKRFIVRPRRFANSRYAGQFRNGGYAGTDKGSVDHLVGVRRPVQDQLNWPVHDDFVAGALVGGVAQRLRAETE